MPADVNAAGELICKRWDQPINTDLQTEIAKKLLKLRVTFTENAYPTEKQVYKVDFKLEDKANNGQAILLVGEKN